MDVSLGERSREVRVPSMEGKGETNSPWGGLARNEVQYRDDLRGSSSGVWRENNEYDVMLCHGAMRKNIGERSEAREEVD